MQNSAKSAEKICKFVQQYALFTCFTTTLSKTIQQKEKNTQYSAKIHRIDAKLCKKKGPFSTCFALKNGQNRRFNL